tara:strand:- start:1194 stop:2486 length:1293 start_codon:yes stop_codon:yes gene_type:complete
MKSVITCDMEGVILTMNKGAEEIFGYDKNELIGLKRVSIFSPGEIVLQNVANWLKTAVDKGEYNGETYFINKNKSKINAKIKITPTYSKNTSNESVQTGYCGYTEVIDKNVNVPINFSTKLIKGLAITRMPFTSASIFPVMIVACYFAGIGDNLFSTPILVSSFFGILIAHLGLNVFNDYFDVKDGTDEYNAEYFQQVSGGSRAIELGLITLDNTKKLGLILITIAMLIGAYIFMNVNPLNLKFTILLTLAGLALGYFYTAPPLRLVARSGLGELSIFLAFGPLLTLGTGFAVYNGDFLNSPHFLNVLLLGIPVGFLTTNILLINEFPDMVSDIKTNKNHLVVKFGKKNSRWLYLLFLILAFSSSILSSFLMNNNLITILSITSLFFGLLIFKHIFKNYDNRELVKSNWNTITLHAIFSILLSLCLIFGF